MGSNYNAGSILYHNKFEFENGETGKKLLLILNNPKDEEPYLFCRTTSKYKLDRSRVPIGCQKYGKYYFIPENTTFLDVDTWLQIHDIREFEKGSFNDDCKNGFIKPINILKEDYLLKIIQCMSNPQNQDVSPEHLDMIKDSYRQKKAILIKNR